MEDETAVVEAWRSGDSRAGRLLVKHYYARIYRFFFGKVGDESCEDLTQETFEIMLRRRDAYRGDAPYRAYLFGIARFVLINHIRRRQRHRERFEPAEDSAMDPDSEGASSLFAAREHERIVAAALRSLPLDDQIAIELRHWEGLTKRELAALFDAPISTMANRLQRARARLRHAIEERLTDPAMAAELDEGLDTCMRSIQAKIQDHLGQSSPDRE